MPPAPIGAELLVVADQAHPPALSQGVADGGVEGGGVGHPGLVDQQQGAGPDLVGPVRQRSVVVEGPGEPGQGVGGDAGGLGELRRGGRGGRQAEDVAAAGGPHVGEHLEGGGLARPGRGEDQLDPAAVRRHRPHHLLLPGVQDGAVGLGLGQAEVDRGGFQGLPVGQSSRVHDSLLGGEDPGGGVLGAAGHGEHRRPIRTPQLRR